MSDPPSTVHLQALTWSEVQDWVVTDGLRIVVTVALALVLRWALHRAIDRVVRSMSTRAAERSSAGQTDERHIQRLATLASLLRSVVTFAVFGVAALTVLSLVGIPLGPLLASAGVGGVALGFGAQSLVKDFLSGVFMIFEDQYGVGDVIDTGEAVGIVEEVSLRVTRLRDASGVTWYVRNGEITRIGNRSQGSSMATVDVPIAYSESSERVGQLIREVIDGMRAEDLWAARIEAAPEVVGIESLTPGAMTMRVMLTCAPNQQYAVQRELRERIKNALDTAGIAAPPVTVVPYAGEPRPSGPAGGGVS